MKSGSKPFADAVHRIVDFFETLTPESARRVDQVYAAHARFVDPFNEVSGLPAIARIYSHMYESLTEPRFIVTNRIEGGAQCVLIWEFKFYFKTFKQSEEQTVFGSSHLRFDDDGKITLHRDYWDAAHELYEKIPVLGGLMRWLRKRANQ